MSRLEIKLAAKFCCGLLSAWRFYPRCAIGFFFFLLGVADKTNFQQTLTSLLCVTHFMMVSFTHSLKLFCIRFFNHLCVNGECCQMFGLFLIAVLLLHRCRVCMYMMYFYLNCVLYKRTNIRFCLKSTLRLCFFFLIMKYYRTPLTRSFSTSTCTKHFTVFLLYWVLTIFH